ncbi:MAG: hypothetical protein FJY98_04750 [Candidatus Liptonbacteria bacterium]|nr:hypothetical protein [Candidatus Liptonbacteria bacterium]
MRSILHFFDKLEDKVRGWFSHFPILYAIVGGVGTVLFWRGVWHTADFISMSYFHPVSLAGEVSTIDYPFLWDGLVSLVLGIVILLITGLFVASFIGDHIIISGVRHEKKVTEKTEKEVKEEEQMIKRVHKELHVFTKKLERLEKKLDGKT